jgi:poly(3-hydroxybutyrate) depolymerase
MHNMSYRAVALSVLLTPFALLGANDALTKETLTYDGQQHSYFLFVPATAASNAPLLMLLHGSGHDGQSLIDPWKELASREGVILIAPSSINPDTWQAVIDGPRPLVAIIDAVRQKHTFDPKRKYLFGHSAGAIFSLFLALREPGFFAAIAAHAGVLKDESWLPTATVKTPIQMQVGTEDPIFPLENVRHTRDLFQAAGFEFELKEIAGHDHNYYVISDQVNRDAWAFLRSKTLAR